MRRNNVLRNYIIDVARLRRAARRHGFAPDRAEVVLSGLCANCAI
jgi:Fe2+ or Zn2+ uptake regulation protein